jgi:hypothetical protein
MNTITYKPQSDGSVRVYLESKLTGTIRRRSGTGWSYRPRGTSYDGDEFPTLEACERSLEFDDEQPTTPQTGGGDGDDNEQ